MTASFWNSWQLWEKLCFVLGCAIVLVVILGCLKLVYNHWKLRKYTKIDAAKAAIKQEMQHSQSVRRGRANQVPFGVRALESGIEVDGVWISRSNTPASSLPASPALSATAFRLTAPHPDLSSGRTSTTSNMTGIEISQLAQEYSEPERPSSSLSAIPNPFDRPMRKHGPPPTSDHQLRGQPTYQPRRSSGLRYSNSFDPEDPETLSTLETPTFSSQKTGKRREGFESETEEGRPSSSHSATSSNSGNGSFNQQSRSEASSNGFLHPEYHKPSKGPSPAAYELSDVDFDSRGQSSCVDENGPLHVSNPQNETTSISHKGHDVGTEGIQGISQKTSNPFVTPNIYPNSGGNHSFHVDDVDDDVADQHARLMDNNEITYDQDHAQPLQPFDGVRRLRSSQVIRKVNSGFQILRPGTLGPPQQTKGLTEWTGDLRGTNKRESKKRQRRGRAPSRSSYTLED